MVQLFQSQAELKTGFLGFLSVEFHYLAYTNSFLDRYEPFCFFYGFGMKWSVTALSAVTVYVYHL